ncbi:hypothetical protein [Leptospira sp. GIMC2001]|uniref:hypothetical protein n=1 Tax=Leptospira sp. GIMC2001 TaxID=1513297 RepID=UPI00234A6172|nr:hypothetical protein [Leptospira sp. GIMC2001]WCL47789.1 hypothetical protein O4O04_00605 [Leptospira sp. GIMC2001]
MNKDERLKLLNNINKGKQNRYGEIEYELSENDRINGLRNILLSSFEISFDSQQAQILSSIIYWNLCSTVTIRDATLRLVDEYYKIDAVRNGFLECLKNKYTLHSRINRIESYLVDFTKLNLSIQKIIPDIIPLIESYQKENEWEQYKEKIQRILNNYKIEINLEY